MARLTRTERVGRGYNYLPQFGYFWGGIGILGTTYMSSGEYGGYYYN